jgi:hypothetical protein
MAVCKPNFRHIVESLPIRHLALEKEKKSQSKEKKLRKPTV